MKRYFLSNEELAKRVKLIPTYEREIQPIILNDKNLPTEGKGIWLNGDSEVFKQMRFRLATALSVTHARSPEEEQRRALVQMQRAAKAAAVATLGSAKAKKEKANTQVARVDQPVIRKVFLFDNQVTDRVKRLGPNYAKALRKAQLNRTPKGIWLDANHTALRPFGKGGQAQAATSPQKTRGDGREVWGPLRWKELHNYALKFGEVTDANRHEPIAWMIGFTRRLPCGECKREWNTHRQTFPEGTFNMFDWTVGVHNAVNKMLGKKEMPVEEARKLYAI